MRLELKNLSWREFCKKNSSFKIIPPSTDDGKILYNDEDQLIIKEKISNGLKNRVFLVNPDDKLIWADNYGDPMVVSLKKQGVPQDIFSVQFYDPKKNIGIDSLLFNKTGKKFAIFYRIIGMKNNNALKQFFHITQKDISSSFKEEANASLDNVRSPNEELTDIDKIRMCNLNSKFRRLSEKLETVKELIEEVNTQTNKTIDHLYIHKLIQLCVDVSKKAGVVSIVS